ncbi:MAG: hypothetical protein H7318_09265 [Oligoflexus sp.]|nr:hypothetical protein [Oligoflexus sp.]
MIGLAEELDISTYRRKILTRLRIFAFIAFATTPLACNSQEVFSDGSIASRKFSGIEGVSLSDVGKLELNWTASSTRTGITYQIEYLKTQALPSVFESASLTAAAPLTFGAVDLEKDEISLVWITVATVKDETACSFDQAMELGSYYIFRVTREGGKLSERHLLAVKAELPAPLSSADYFIEGWNERCLGSGPWREFLHYYGNVSG